MSSFNDHMRRMQECTSLLPTERSLGKHEKNHLRYTNPWCTPRATSSFKRKGLLSYAVLALVVLCSSSMLMIKFFNETHSQQSTPSNEPVPFEPATHRDWIPLELQTEPKLPIDNFRKDLNHETPFRSSASHGHDVINAEEQEQAPFCDSVAQTSGYISLSNKHDDHYFYWFFESRRDPTNDPLILWLTGGPGCSSLMALLTENGPCQLNSKMHLQYNPYAWNTHANVIWLDQPSGVGFSYFNAQKTSYDFNEVDVGENAYAFLQGWFKKHPQFKNSPFYVFGESYGGHYVPSVAAYILKKNMEERKEPQEERLRVQLTGISIGNGLTNPVIQYQHFADLAYQNAYNLSLVEESMFPSLVNATENCVAHIEECQRDHRACLPAIQTCNEKVMSPIIKASKRNPYDIRSPCLTEDLNCYDQQKITTFLNFASVQNRLLHVNTTVAARTWEECNMVVNVNFQPDWMRSYEDQVVALLESGINVLVYAGDADLMCNWKGNEAWVQSMPWKGMEAYQAAVRKDFMVQGKVVGHIQSTEGLSFVRIFNAGHMVPMDQPIVALSLLQRFLESNMEKNHDVE